MKYQIRNRKNRRDFRKNRFLIPLILLRFTQIPPSTYNPTFFLFLLPPYHNFISNTQTEGSPMKFLIFITSKVPTSALSVVLKTTLALCTFASLSLLPYFAFSNSPRSADCPHCETVYRNSSSTRINSGLVRPLSFEAPTNLSHVLFGIAGSAQMWNDRRLYTELWWLPNVTRGYVWLDEEPLENTTRSPMTPPHRISADTSEFNYTCWYGSRSAIRIARIIKESFELGVDGLRWFVMGDDDTVFFTENLITVLGKYDHNQMYYIGANSESVEQDMIHSYTMAYGGGGFAISYPLAKELVRILDGCINRYADLYGSDQKVQGCLSEIGVPVTKELGFHQLDIRGCPYGLLAAHPLAPLVSFHHLDYVEPIFPSTDRIESVQKLMNAHQLDPSRTLQHSFCYDPKRNWTVSISWGYTVQLYPTLVPAKELETAFQTFQSWKSWSSEPFTFNTRGMSQNPCERPVVYFLDEARNVGRGETLTTYLKYVEKEECGRWDYAMVQRVRGFNVSALKFSPRWWSQAPRRQCCQVIGEEEEGEEVEVVRMKIRGCNPMESVTPPP
ncbi:hypothetical protein MLD38_029946 [Melastoma candidum]|uniref:Uncharacterized protein n=1 Tax=Melastoma candidum TaxID=119954 RepID=A0ACB9MK82_9MYRT|nr:hypothetical protein MLD38_029946 [Melastoma candidum]